MAALVAVTLVASACSDDDDSGGAVATEATTEGADPVAAAEQRVTDAEAGVTQSQESLTEAHGAFCSATTGYIETLDRYGRVFTDSAATVGDIKTLGADLTEPAGRGRVRG